MKALTLSTTPGQHPASEVFAFRPIDGDTVGLTHTLEGITAPEHTIKASAAAVLCRLLLEYGLTPDNGQTA